MKVVVKAFATIREALGRGWMSMELEEGVDVKRLLEKLSEIHGERFTKLVLDPDEGKVAAGVKVLVNGRDIEFLEGLRTRLRDGDVVALIPPVAGG